MSKFKTPPGTNDLLSPDAEAFDRVVEVTTDLFQRYGYKPITTPIFEQTEVFTRSLDDSSDLVIKEMYSFQDRSGRHMSLRPEGTAPVIRAVLEHSLHKRALPVKLYYSGPMFRFERPQKGRTRSFSQVGVEAIGSAAPELDAEVIELGFRCFRELGIQPKVALNSIGHPGCRETYIPKLKAFLQEHREQLCDDCKVRTEKNPLRAFDCKVPSDRELLRQAPLIGDNLCADCEAHFAATKSLLSDLEVPFELDPTLVRGLDYYTRTTFTYVGSDLGAQDELGGGGRYDGLSELLGGDSMPGIGFALGVDRILLSIKDRPLKPIDVYFVSIGEEARPVALKLATQLRDAGVSADIEYMGRAVKGQFRSADRSGARWAVILGDKELKAGGVTLRDLESGGEESVDQAKLLQRLRSTG